MGAAQAGVAGYIAAWRPSSVPAEAARFARAVVAAAGPHGRPRAKNLLWAAGKLAGYGIGLGPEPVPQVLLHPSTAGPRRAGRGWVPTPWTHALGCPVSPRRATAFH
jgi:hypothetical protein